ncbi:DUF6984 family protein [Rhodoglobus sp.]
MSTSLRVPPTSREREVLIAVAAEQPFDVPSREWEQSALLTIAASFAAINDIWTDEQNAHVIDVLSKLLSHDDPAIVAGAATRAAVLSGWWDSSMLEDPNGRETKWAELAVEARPDWVLNWLKLSDCFDAQRRFLETVEIAQHLAQLPTLAPPGDPFDVAFELIFTGRLEWTKRKAKEFLASSIKKAQAADSVDETSGVSHAIRGAKCHRIGTMRWMLSHLARERFGARSAVSGQHALVENALLSLELTYRSPTEAELRLLRALVKRTPRFSGSLATLSALTVALMNDGGMGSLAIGPPSLERRFEDQVAEVTFFDVDGMWVSATLNVDQFDELFELDVFKGDFSPLREIPQTFQ